MPRPRRPDPKLHALSEQGTLHPRPERVTDPPFLEGGFFDPRDLLQVKYEMLRRVRVERQSVAGASSRCGLSRPTFYTAQSAFDRGGLAGLLPAKRGPRGPHKLTEEVMDFIEELLATDATVDVGALAQRIEHRFGRSVHPRTVERALERRKKKRR